MNLSGLSERYIRKLIKNFNRPYVIEFFADWCVPCKKMDALLDGLDNTVDVLKINIEEQPALMKEYGVNSVPFLLYIKDNEIVRTATGAMSRDELFEFVRD